MKWITARDLEQWANTLESRTRFPELVADLIRASVSWTTAFRFPSGEMGTLPGLDGVLDVPEQESILEQAASYLPVGRSCWELGTAQDVKNKAESDYDKRTDEIDDGIRQITTLVLVTPHPWKDSKQKKDEWVLGLGRRKAPKEWKEIRLLDAVELEHWLEVCPAVAARYAREVLKLVPPTGVCSADEFWDSYSRRFSPPLAEEVLLSGRDQALAQRKEIQVEVLLNRLEAPNKTPSDPWVYKADSSDEAVAFMIAAVRKSDENKRKSLEARLLLLHTAEAVQQIANGSRFLQRDEGAGSAPTSGLIFVLHGQAAAHAGLLKGKGLVLIACGRNHPCTGNHMESLEPRTNHEFAQGLTAMGFEYERAYNLAWRSGRNLAVLARLIPSGGLENPSWLDDADVLVSALLAGSWSILHEADKAVLQALGGEDSYERVERPLRKLLLKDDSPVERTDGQWTVSSSEDLFLRISSQIGSEHLECFRQQFLRVFSEAPNGAYSEGLRSGMANTLLNIAALSAIASFRVPGLTTGGYVSQLLRDLFNPPSALARVADQLPVLAEAAPEVFLEALEKLLCEEEEVIRELLPDRRGPACFREKLQRVVWALECLAWTEGRLLKVARCLARLAAVSENDAEKTALDSLSWILNPGIPQTCASVKERSAVLADLVKQWPQVAWRMLLLNLPSAREYWVFVTTKPRFFTGNDQPQIGEQVRMAIDSVVDSALTLAGRDLSRWREIVKVIPRMSDTAFGRVNEAFRRFSADRGDSFWVCLWNVLYLDSRLDEEFRDEDVRMPQGMLSCLKSLLGETKPDRPELQNIWLFEGIAYHCMEEGGGDADEKLATSRKTVVQSFVDHDPEEGLSELVRLLRDLGQFDGFEDAVKACGLSEEILSRGVIELVKLDGSAREEARTLLAEGYQRFGDNWARSVVGSLRQDLDLDDSVLSSLLFRFPNSKDAWDFVRSLGERVDSLFWRGKKTDFFFEASREDAQVALHRLINDGQAVRVLGMVTLRHDRFESDALASLLHTVEQELVDGVSDYPCMCSDIHRIIKVLAQRQDLEHEQIRQLRIALLPYAQTGNAEELRETARLFSRDAELFVDAVVHASQRNNGDCQSAQLILREVLVVPPGENLDGSGLDAEVLSAWVSKVRALALEREVIEIADHVMGSMLARSQPDPVDGLWPPRPVRTVIEDACSEALEEGFQRAVLDGLFYRRLGHLDHEAQARADEFNTWASAMSGCLRTAALLRRLARSKQGDVERSIGVAAKERGYF